MTHFFFIIYIDEKYSFSLFFVLLGLLLMIFNLIISYEASLFNNPTFLKVHPPISEITAHVTMPVWSELSIISFCFMLLVQIQGG